MANVFCQSDSGVPIFNLFLGSKGGADWRPSDRQKVFVETSKFFENFTISEADGCYQGRLVPTLVIRIGTDDRESVMRLVSLLGQFTKQKEIGVEVFGRYTPAKISQD